MVQILQLASMAVGVSAMCEESSLLQTKVQRETVGCMVSGPKFGPCDPPTTTQEPLPDRSVCEVMGDPHIKTFDGEARDEQFYNYGDYWLVKNDKLWIQARYDSESGAKSSVRAIAVSEPKPDGTMGTVVVVEPSLYGGINVSGVPLVKQGTYVKSTDKNCYGGKGGDAAGIPYDNIGKFKDPTTGKLDEAACQAACNADVACHCVVQQERGRCFKRSSCVLDDCVDQLGFHTFVSTEPELVMLPEIAGGTFGYARDGIHFHFRLEALDVSITVTRADALLNLMIDAPASFSTAEDPTSGHCGNFNGDASDDKVEESSFPIETRDNPFTSKIWASLSPSDTECDDEEAGKWCSAQYVRAGFADANVDIEDCVVDYCNVGKTAAAVTVKDDVALKQRIQVGSAPDFEGSSHLYGRGYPAR